MSETKMNAQNNEISLMIKNAMILFLITLIAGVLLGFVYDNTKASIAEQTRAAEENATKEVFPSADSFGDIKTDTAKAAEILSCNKGYSKVELESVKEAKDKSGSVIGYAFKVKSKGYSSDALEFMVGLTKDGTLNGISLISNSESPGLGMNANDILVPQFKDVKNADSEHLFSVKKQNANKENHEIQAITAATITSKAITNGVDVCIEYMDQVLLQGGAK